MSRKYLRVDDENLALWDPNLPITQLIRVSVSKARIEGIVV